MFESYELTEAPDKRSNDYWITPTTLDPDQEIDEQRYQVWSVTDKKFQLAVEDDAPEEAISVVEGEGFDAVWASDVKSERIKIVRTEVREKTAFYAEDPPDEIYTTVGKRRAQKFLDRRGIEYARHKDSWWYPKKEEFVCLYTKVDDSGEASEVIWRPQNLSAEERKLILKGEDIDKEDDEVGREDIAELIESNSPIYPRESEIASCWADGITDYKAILRELNSDDITYQSVAQSCYNFRDRQKAVSWMVLHVWQHIPSNLREPEVERIIDALEEMGELEEVRNPAFEAPGAGRGGGHPKDANLNGSNGTQPADD